jgi:hypothetical protein
MAKSAYTNNPSRSIKKVTIVGLLEMWSKYISIKEE